MRGWLAVYRPIPMATRNAPETISGMTKALAVGVLPQKLNPAALAKVMMLNSHTILAEKTSPLAHSILSFSKSIFR